MIGAWALWSALAVAAPGEEVAVDYRGYLDQARFFVKKGWYPDAAEQLELATRHPDGRLDPEVWFLLARVRYALADLDGARDAAERALTMSRDEAQAAATTEWLEFLARSFGTVELTGPRPGLTARVSLELKGTLLDPELKACLARAQERLAEPVELPLRLGLPAGYRYVVGDTEVEVAAGEVRSVSVAVQRAAVQRVEVPLSLGVGSWVNPDFGARYPAPTMELGVVVPVGAVVAGARGGLVAQVWETGSLSGFALPASLTAELGADARPERAIGVRMGGALRWTRVPGHAGGCGPAADCAASATTDAALVPGAWLAVPVRDPNRASGVVVDLRVVGERGWGPLRDHPFADDWTAWGTRVLLDVAWSP